MLNLKKCAIIAPLVLSYSLAYSAEDNKSLKERMKQFGQGLEQKMDDARTKMQDARENMQNYGSQAGDRLRESGGNLQHNLRERARQYSSQFNPTSLDYIVNDNLMGIYQNPAKLYQFQEMAGNKVVNASVGMVKGIPVYDPREGDVKTFDAMLRDSLSEFNSITGIPIPPEISDDPVKAMILLGIKNDYLLSARLIRNGDDWTSVKEMLSTKEGRQKVKDAVSHHAGMVASYDKNDYNSLGDHLEGFTQSIEHLNRRQQMSDRGLLSYVENNFIYNAVDSLHQELFPPNQGGLYGILVNENFDRTSHSHLQGEYELRKNVNYAVLGASFLAGLLVFSRIIKGNKQSRNSNVQNARAQPIGKKTLQYDSKTGTFKRTDIPDKKLEVEYNQEDLP